MKHGSLFSGIGGFDLAAEWMGWENMFHCEINKFCQKVLKKNFPGVELYEDIKQTEFTKWNGSIDIITGGFPCQPYSTAGKRKGKEDDRHLWPEMLRAIREIHPRWVVGENVPGLLNWKRGMVLDEIKADLEAAGFEVFPSLVLPACSKNAPHRRDRLWIIAYASQYRSQMYNNGFGDSLRIFKEAPNNFSKSDAIARIPIKRNFGELRNGNGLSNRVDRISALGNAIVPQVVFEIFKAIDQMDKNL